jgi:subtilisin family serine protease
VNVTTTSRRKNAVYGAIVTTALALAMTAIPAQATASSLSPAVPPPVAGRYIVTLADKPIATYQGGVPGITGTKPAKGAKVDTAGPNARRYRSHLTDEQTKVAATVGATPIGHYAVATNGFVAELSALQAVKLMKTTGVISVVRDELHKPTDDRNSTDFLRLSGSNGLWSALGGTANAGKGVVVGVIDTGIWPESRSFAAPALDTTPPTADAPYRPYLQGTATVMRKADGGTFTGTCQIGDQFTADVCNEKIISARYFGEGWMSAVSPDNRADYISPRDGQGHGTHTASTAAGDAEVDAAVDGNDFGKISGVAPGAAIAVYKALWEGKTANTTGGTTSDIVAAIDQAVADGVDVINYSVGTTAESAATNPIQLAFLSAASVGIFVSASAGNSGPLEHTLDNTAPWETTVAASTVEPHAASVVLGNGARYTGVSTTITATVGPKPLVPGASVKNATATDKDASLCQDNTLDPAKVTDKIVLCVQGVNARVDKSAEVARAGGAGMVLVDLSIFDALGDLHSVPTVHLTSPDSLAVRDYAETAGAQVSLVRGGTAVPYPQIATFSSRGPSTVSDGDLLKPDIAAPGVSILAAVAPPTNNGHDFDFYSGTSMAAPHIAGLAALYFGKYPNWSPMAVKSAMMTTAVDTKTATGTPNTDLFAQGAGEVNPSQMFNPGLVYDSSEQDWLGYLQSRGVDTGSGVPAIDPSDLNYPSIAIGQFFESQTITRKVTAVTPGVYKNEIDIPGVEAVVRPSTLRFDAAGQTQEFTVTLTQRTAELGLPVMGSLTWTGGGTTVRSPIVLTPQDTLAPAQVSGSGDDGTVSFPITPHVGKFPIAVYGLASGPLTPGSVSSASPQQDFPFTVAENTKVVEANVRSDNPQASLITLLAREINGLYTVVAVSDGGTADARVSLPNPEPGKYLAVVLTFGDAPGTTSTPFTFQTNLVGAQGGIGDITVSPKKSKVTPGTPLTVTVSWSRLSSGARHTGYVEYPNGAGTVVTIN